MPAKVIMLQGSMSSSGKSLLVTGLCRLYARMGYRVAPFKAQNMSNNAAVCKDSSEIGRSQYTQALACGVEPQAVMNPVLLKPEADARSQVIVLGKPYASLPAKDYYQKKKDLWQVITHALDSLIESYELIIIEGAGSPVELNLKYGDLVNMAVARYAKAPVLLAGDIDRGGIFAQLLGTLDLFDPQERALVKGLLVNKFRGDPDLFTSGIQILQDRSGVPVLGVIPYINHHIPEEDGVAVEAQNIGAQTRDAIDIAVIRLPRIANFDDFDPIAREPGVSVRYIDSPQEIKNANAIIIPGTKSTTADLIWLQAQGLASAIREFAEQGGTVIGICGGYQMLGKWIKDPCGIESETAEAEGLSLLSIGTTFIDQKSTHQVSAVINNKTGWSASINGEMIQGYEIHMGKTQYLDGKGWLSIKRQGGSHVDEPDGAMNENGQIWGCYVHGLFENNDLRHAWLRSLGWDSGKASPEFSLDQSFDQLADVLEKSLNMDKLNKIIGL